MSLVKYDVWRIGPPDKGKSEPRNEKFKASLMIGQLFKFFHEYAEPGYFRAGDPDPTPHVYLLKREGIVKQETPMVYKKMTLMGRDFFVKFQADLFDEVTHYFSDKHERIVFADIKQTKRRVVMG